MNLSKYFSMEEFIRSNTAAKNNINNALPIDLIDNAKAVCLLADIVRQDILKRPCYFNSAYRCKELNGLVGGSPTSSHLDGRAVDIRMDYSYSKSKIEQEKIKDYFLKHKDEIEFDAVILYHKINSRFVHINVAKPGEKGRRKVFYAMGNNVYEEIT